MCMYASLNERRKPLMPMSEIPHRFERMKFCQTFCYRAAVEQTFISGNIHVHTVRQERMTEANGFHKAPPVVGQ